MKQYDFDGIIDRMHTNCIKYDGCRDIYKADDLIPLWVADMDFPTPDFVIKAIQDRIKHPVLGYFKHSEQFYQSIINWVLKRHSWKVKKEWIYSATGVMPSIFFLVQLFTAPGDKVLIQPPVYCPFYSVIGNQIREIVRNPLKLINDHYEMDYDQLEDCLRKGVKLMILCNPHNPVGRCWTLGELKKIGELCIKYHCLIVSDEIYSDLIMPGYTHTPMASISEEIAQNTITCISTSKTFNLAGLSTSEIIIPNISLRKSFDSYKQGCHIFAGNVFGEIALETCYMQGEMWLSQLLNYLKGNVDFIQQYIKENIPRIKTFRHEATYLLWLDFSHLGLQHEEIAHILVKRAKLAISDGADYGKEGQQYFRLNVACPRTILEKAMIQLEKAFA